MNPFIQIGNEEVYSYSLLINIGSVIGVLVAMILLLYYFKNWKKAITIFTIQFALIQLGNGLGKFIRGISYTDLTDASGVTELFTKYHGTHFIGRVIFVMVIFPLLYWLIYRRRRGMVEALNAISIFCVIQHLFNRLACLMNGCCFGSTYSGKFAIRFKEGIAAASGVDYMVYPTQIMEMLGMVLLLIVLLAGIKMKKSVAPWFCIGFGMVIYITEEFMSKMGERMIWNISFIQLAASILMLIGVSLFFMIKSYEKNVYEVPAGQAERS